MSHRIAVLGATGLVGRPVALALLRHGHAVLAVVRRDAPANAILAAAGAKVVILPDLAKVGEDGVEPLASALREFGADTMIVATRAATEALRTVAPLQLRAAVESGTVRRYVPNEYGVHTRALDYGVGVLFDAKKDMQKLVFESGLDWTLMFVGGMFDYFLPNLRFFDKIFTCGNMDATFPTHDIGDIGELVARAAVDPRCRNKCLQINGNIVTQEQLLSDFRRLWPGRTFEVEHHTTEEILRLRDTAKPGVVSAKAGNESDQERWGINYAIYGLGQMAAPAGHPETVLSTDLWPDFRYRTPSEAMASDEFVFGKI